MKPKTAPLTVLEIITLGESGVLLTEGQIGAVYQISAATISRMVHANEIPYVFIRAGGRKKTVRFKWSEVQRWIQTRSRGPARSKPRKELVSVVATQENKSPKLLNSNGARQIDKSAAEARERTMIANADANS